MTLKTRLLPAALFLPLVLSACVESAGPAATAGTGATASAAAPAEGSVAMPAGLSSEERFLWGTMTPEAQAQAAAYIASGGTLTQFLAL